MLELLSASWNRLKQGRPGHRFCALHQQRQRERQNLSPLGRNAPAALGVILVVGGLAVGWLPGPGGFVAVLGFGLLAMRFRFAARVLDWSELRLLALWRHGWTRRSVPGRAIVLAFAALLAAGAIYAARQLLWS